MRLKSKVRIYRLTISTTWYDQRDQQAKELELHYKVARHGKIKTVRTHLTKRGVPHYQQTVYRLTKRWIRKRKVKARFEREQPALKSQQYITIEARRMEYRGKQWEAHKLHSRKLSYARRRRKKRPTK